MNFFKKLFSKNNSNQPRKTLSESKQIKIMQDKNLTYTMQLVEVFYSLDKKMRYVLLRRKDGKFSIKLEKLFLYDEKALNALPANSLPGYWEPLNFGVALFKTEEDAIAAMKKEDEYKSHFEKSEKK
ncbi:MAG: hypothetical protein J6A51_01495 [Clostridia bacterium]|nr:hypothetical protein [Clostridia bacterium]